MRENFSNTKSIKWKYDNHNVVKDTTNILFMLWDHVKDKDKIAFFAQNNQ